MALFIRQNENRSQLQERLAAELQDKARSRSQHEPPDGVTDSAYLKDTKKTTSLAWAWVIITILAVVAIFMTLLFAK